VIAPVIGESQMAFCLDPAAEAVLEEYETRQAAENVLMTASTSDEVSRRRDELLVSVGRATGVLLNGLVREIRARSILELGTAYGYSTIWLADAARATGGRVFTVDVAAGKQEHARAALHRAGLLEFVDFSLGDALEFLAKTGQTYDFVLLDLWKDLYIPCLDALLGHLDANATIVADNMLAPASARMAAARYRAHIEKVAALTTTVLPVGNGLAVSRYSRVARPHQPSNYHFAAREEGIHHVD
jgi:predicted O-methyltransferase YrrM